MWQIGKNANRLEVGASCPRFLNPRWWATLLTSLLQRWYEHSDLRNIDNKGGNCLYFEQERRVTLRAEDSKRIVIPLCQQNSRNT